MAGVMYSNVASIQSELEYLKGRVSRKTVNIESDVNEIRKDYIYPLNKAVTNVLIEEAVLKERERLHHEEIEKELNELKEDVRRLEREVYKL